MPRCLNHLNIFILATLLTACGGGSSGSDNDSGTPSSTEQVFSVSGTIRPAVLVDIDSDINDSDSIANISNDTFNTAQVLQNYYTVNGFATAERTDRAGDRFENDVDESDFFQVNLQAGQSIRLQIVNFESTTDTESVFRGDLDLILFDSDFEIIGRSESTTEFESLSVPLIVTSNNYYIQVFAFSGTSKYVLSIDPVSDISTSKFSKPKFVMNEAIIKFKDANPLSNDSSISASSVNTSLNSSTLQKTLNNAPLQLSHHSYNRATLAKFASSIQPLPQASSTNITSSSEESAFLSELKVLNPDSYEYYTTLNAIKKLRLRDDVVYAQPNYIRSIQQVPNDTHYTKQWHYPAINLPQAWDLTTGTPDVGSVIVAVIDTGVFLDHEDLNGKLVPGYDFIRDPSNSADNDGIDPNPDDPGDGDQVGTSSWHGTHVAGTIAAETNNTIGVAGVSWGAKIMPLRALGLQGGTDYDIGQAALFAARLENDSGAKPTQIADIINMSIGGPGGSDEQLQFSQDIFDQVRAAGVIIVAAAGNESSSQSSYPAAHNGVISVSATGFDNNLAPYSNFGSTIDIAAPGGNSLQDSNNDGLRDGVLSTLVDDSSGSRKSSYVLSEGTSMAAPHVAGVIALMRAVYPALSPDDVDTLLAAGNLTNDIGASGRDNLFGHGLIDAFKAVKEAQALSNGGVAPELPPLVVVSPSSLTLGTNSSGTLTISNSGGGTPTITSFNTNGSSWLTLTPNSVDEGGLGTYEVSADRTSLPETTYSDTITFNIDTGTELKTLNVQVSMIVGATSTEGNIGTQYILLIDSSTDELVDQATPSKNINGEYNYQFSNISAGSYQILGGSDIDNDLIICQLGESCGGYPVLNKLSNVLLTDTNISGLDFVSGVLSNFGATSSSTPSVKAVKLKHAPDSERPSSKKINGAFKE